MTPLWLGNEKRRWILIILNRSSIKSFGILNFIWKNNFPDFAQEICAVQCPRSFPTVLSCSRFHPPGPCAVWRSCSNVGSAQFWRSRFFHRRSAASKERMEAQMMHWNASNQIMRHGTKSRQTIYDSTLKFQAGKPKDTNFRRIFDEWFHIYHLGVAPSQ